MLYVGSSLALPCFLLFSKDWKALNAQLFKVDVALNNPVVKGEKVSKI